MTIPGIGPITAMAFQAFAPPMEGFRRGRDFSAWLGLVPRQHTTGGKPRLGKISKMGQRDLRRLLITGAMTVVQHATRRGDTADPWLARMLARKPRMLVAVALANRMARIAWETVKVSASSGSPEQGSLTLAAGGVEQPHISTHGGATRHNRERIATGTDQLGLAVKSVSGIAVSAQEPGVPARFHAPIAPTNRCFCRQCSENAAPPSSFITRLKL